MWAKPTDDGHYSLANSPFFAAHNWHDVVRCRARADGVLEVVGLERSGGHRTLRVLFEPLAARETIDKTLDDLRRLGGTYEGAGQLLYAVDFPPAADLGPAERLLARQHERGLLDWRKRLDDEFRERSLRAADPGGLVVRHVSPATDVADGWVLADIGANPHTRRDWEELWTRKQSDGYRLLSIPFFARGLALGDVLGAAAPREGMANVLQGVVAPSGHYTIRVVLREERHELDLLNLVDEFGAVYERQLGTPLYALHAESGEAARGLTQSLQRLEDAGKLFFETAW